MDTNFNRSPLFSLFFWLFNLTLLLIAYVGLLPFIGPGFVADALKGELPLDFLLFLIGLVGVPTTVTIISLNNTSSKKRSIPLTKLFYGVEVPMLAVCMLRFFWLRELTPSSILILITGCICVGAYLHQLIYNQPAGKGAWVQLVCHSLMLAIALYVGLLALFYVLPISAAILYSIFYRSTETIFLVIFWSIVIFPVAVILIAIATGPFGITSVYFQAWRQNLIDFASRYGWNKAWLGTTAVIMSWLLLLVATQKQPQTDVFALLQKPIVTQSDRAFLVQRSEKIRKGLLNAYLAPYRYQDYGQENTNIRDLYVSVFHWQKNAAQTLQNTYNILASPFLYQGRRADRDTAAKLYAEFFDTPILRGEQAAIQKAVQSTFNRTEARAGLLDINEKKVWLAEQQIKVEPQGDWANVEVYEIYKNQTFEDQEIFYSFSLPQSAVITGVWLGNNRSRSSRFPFIVSTRGAAQQVYTQQVQRRVDPALLEQIGPNNYRLRAFPIPAGEGKELHLWMTYQTLQTKDGIPLPQLSEKRNIYWTKDTKRLSNSQAVKSTQDSWFPPVIAANPVQPLQHQTNLNGYQITAKPLTSQDYHLPQNKHIAVVLDTSYSMAAHTKEAVETFNRLKALAVASNDFDLYQTSAPGIAATKIDNITKFDVEKLTFYGTMQPLDMLQQFEKLRGNTAYDAILLISDRGSYELGDEIALAISLPAPLWIVHLGGVQSAYDDAIFETIQASGGGVATKVQDALERFTTQSELKPAVISVDDGYAWFSKKTDIPADPKDEFNPFAARQLVDYLSQDRDLQKIANLDGIHKVAKASQIVTPYSSMIVLVNDQQKQDLKAAEQKSDRFKREIEDKPAPQTSNPLNVSAVPEPAEWMLILVVAIALGLIIKRKQANADGRRWTQM